VLQDLRRENLLLLSEGHCLAEQSMDVCRIKDRQAQGELADLRASSLETLIQLVGAGYGITLVPALALRGSTKLAAGVDTQPLSSTNASRRVVLVYRRSYHRKLALQAFADVIFENLPNSVVRAGDGIKEVV